jgi:hypothetical protein
MCAKIVPKEPQTRSISLDCGLNSVFSTTRTGPSSYGEEEGEGHVTWKFLVKVILQQDAWHGWLGGLRGRIPMYWSRPLSQATARLTLPGKTNAVDPNW